ncbi:MAG: transglutaminase family protein [Fibrella sp.]|nr:transglutaminase family protein [Armatimonadota bacterium]
MFVTVSATADYDLPVETFLLLMIEPRVAGETHRVVRESLRTTPTPFARLDVDTCGNPFRRFLAPKGFFCFDFNATIEVEPNPALSKDATETAPQQLPVDVLPFTLPSRYCPSDRLIAFASSEFGRKKTGAAKVQAIADWINAKIRYEYNTTDASTSAEEVILKRAGVCRDFAHLVVALCRAMSLPARYVSGYCLGLDPPDFHAWAQVYLSGKWHNIDATFAGTRPALVPIAYGRDAADVSLLTLWSPATVREQSVAVYEIHEEDILTTTD